MQTLEFQARRGSMAVHRVTVTIGDDEYKWIRASARKRAKSISAIVAEATREARRAEAADVLIEALGDAAKYTDAQAEELRRELGAEPSTTARAKVRRTVRRTGVR